MTLPETIPFIGFAWDDLLFMVLAAVMVGSALRYSWAQRDTAPRMTYTVDTTNATYTTAAWTCPAFVGPTSDLTKLAGLAPGSYVRYEVPEGGSDLFRQVQAQYHQLHLIQVLCPAKVNENAPRLEVGGGKDEVGRVGALRSYVDYSGKNGTLPGDPEEMMAMGMTLIHGGSK